MPNKTNMLIVYSIYQSQITMRTGTPNVNFYLYQKLVDPKINYKILKQIST